MEKKEAMKILKDFYDKSALFSIRTALDTVIPELKESEEEKTKRILHSISSKMSFHLRDIFTEEEFQCFDTWSNAWLEKQGEKPKKHDVCDNCDQQGSCVSPCPMELVEKHGEKKPVNKVEPKFHEGDFILNGDLTDDGKTEIFRVLKVCDTWYDVENIYDSRHTIITFKQEYSCRVWNTIQDAKDGDVLAEDSCIFIVQKLDDNYTSAKTYCTLYDDGDFDNGTILFFDIDSTKPATKEQRDLLFQKMHEAGYEWDAGKLELRKVEQKQKIQPKFKIGDIIRFKGNETLKGEAETHKIVSYDNELYVFADGTTDLFCEQDMYELVEQKSWSEEDESMLQNILECLKNGWRKLPTDILKYESWLKSLKERCTWKPSDKQMEALKEAGDEHWELDGLDPLYTLYQDLKKLKG